MDEFWLKQTKLWLLEHSLKYDMEDVTKYILKDKNIIEHFSQSLSNPDIHPSIQPTVVFLLLLKNLRKCLQKFQKFQSYEILCWEKETLSLIIEIIDSSFQQTSFIPFQAFLKLIKILKLMEIFRMLFEGVDSRTIVQKLNLHFPRWNAKYKEGLQKIYKNECEASIDKFKSCNTDCRRFILKLTVNDTLRTNYISTSYAKDLKQFISKSIPLLSKVINVVEKLVGSSAVEKFINSADEDFSASDDPAVQILLEYLRPDMKQEDFLELMQVLEPNEQVQPENFMSLCLGSPCGLSEESYLQNTEDCFSEGQRFILSMNEGFTPIDSQKISHKRNGLSSCLGLCPPSSKRMNHVSEPKILEVQEDMELILDSDDED